MTEEMLIDAIGLIDDELINDTYNAKKRRRNISLIRSLSLAACLALVVLGAFVFKGAIGNESVNYTQTTVGDFKYGGGLKGTFSTTFTSTSGNAAINMEVKSRNPLGFTGVTADGRKFHVRITRNTGICEYGDFTAAKERVPLPEDLPLGSKVMVCAEKFKEKSGIFSEDFVCYAETIIVFVDE